MLHVSRTAGGSLVCDDTRDLPTLRREIRREFELLPGLQLTFVQAQRLWSLDADRCARVLTSLVRDGLLEITSDGCYQLAARLRWHRA